MAIIPRTTAKIVLVHGDSTLLCHRPGEPIWHLPGGALEGRETPEQALRRELREEVGVPLAWAAPVTELEARWQPFGNLHDTVHEQMTLFVGQLAGMGREGIRTRMDGGEPLLTKWFPVAHIVPCASSSFMVRPVEILPWILRLAGQVKGYRG
jgi:ADP-ribose pyrophosphatase YjhB (NUDIX family)